MKKIIFTLLTGLFISLSAFAQNYTVTVGGYVMMAVNNTLIAVENQPVTIMIDSTSFGFSYQNTVYTNNNGYYEDIIAMPGYNGYAYVQTMTYDSCLGYYQYNGAPILPNGQMPSLDFYLCNSTPVECQASFYYFPSEPNYPYTYSFVNQSSGNYTTSFWSFGDSTFSTETNPIHTFPGPGTYSVCLTISDGADCSSTWCDYVIPGGTGGGCENYFLYYNSNNDPFTVTFEGYLANGQYADYYSWDFGDGTNGSGQTITHTYTPQGIGMYMVGLTTMVYDPSTQDSCMSTSYMEVWIQNQTGCYASFFYFPDSMDLKTIHFQDMSYDANGAPPNAWFWDFGDNTTSTLQNPVHTYADTGSYYVCLTINTLDSCTSNYCEDIYTGYPPPPSGCESFIITTNITGLTVDFEGYTVSNYETEYNWEFGDGVTATGQLVSHTYPSMGMYNVTLNTVDATGCTYQVVSQVWLDSTNVGGCSAMYTYEQTDSTTFTFSGYVYLNNGAIYPDSSATYSWDFGDGTTGTGQTITHYFQGNPAGGYNVCLTANTFLSDGSTCTATYCGYIPIMNTSFSIFGHVFLENNLPADQAIVRLMSTDSLWQGVVEVQTTYLDSIGFYSFGDVPLYNARFYYVQAELTQGSAYYGQYVPTYYTSALSWEVADPVLPLNNWPFDIFMIPSAPCGSGNGSIGGVVLNLGARSMMNDVEVVLMDNQNNPLLYTRSNDQGYFAFNNLALGTYVIHAEIPGIHTNEAAVTLSEQLPVAGVEVRVSGDQADVVFGIDEHKVALDNISEIYPNPVNDNSRIDFTVKKATGLEVSIYGITGQLMSSTLLNLDAGTQSVKLETATLPEGIYFVRMISTQGDNISRKLVKSR